MADETLSLFGFGLDSFVEILSGIGIWHLVRQMKHNPDMNPGPFEKKALRITGTSFFMLTEGLVIAAVINLFQGYRLETIFWGIVIAVLPRVIEQMLVSCLL